jgi:hypothetical protein
MRPDFLYVAPTRSARAAFSKESRMKFASAAKVRRKSAEAVGAALYRGLPKHTRSHRHGVHPDVTRPAGSLTVHSHGGKRGSEAGVELGVW